MKCISWWFTCAAISFFLAISSCRAATPPRTRSMSIGPATGAGAGVAEDARAGWYEENQLLKSTEHVQEDSEPMLSSRWYRAFILQSDNMPLDELASILATVWEWHLIFYPSLYPSPYPPFCPTIFHNQLSVQAWKSWMHAFAPTELHNYKQSRGVNSATRR